jgi:SAM-dependent methyltransferase
MEEKWVVHRIEDGMDPRYVEATTYQMRNPFSQFADGVVTELEVHCYFQHLYAAKLCPPQGRVLDVCCGRGLMIPFLRYNAQPSCYIGVDLEPKNCRWKDGADPRREKNKKTDWGFRRVFVQVNAARMAPVLKTIVQDFDLIVYTSSIEHMQPSDQQASLIQCGEVSHEDTKLYLTCPVSDEGQSGYEAQYRAHVYEPSRTELYQWLGAAGWEVIKVIGLSTKSTKWKAELQGAEYKIAQHMYNVMPRAQALPAIAALFPEVATEMAYECRRKENA